MIFWFINIVLIIIEFDLNEEVTAIAKGPVIKKTKKVKPAISSWVTNKI